MREEPSAAELIDIVAVFLRDEVMPKLDGRTGFHVRVAANVLDIVRRELEIAPEAEGREAARLAELLGRDGDLTSLNAALCDAIASGSVGTGDPALIRHLWETTLDTVAVDQPKYATYRRAAALVEGKNE